jgi:hypothetical protein
MTAPRVLEAGIPDRVNFAFDGSILVNKYDLVYHDTDDVKPVSSQADQGTEALNQAAIAPKFAGVAMETRLLADTAAVTEFPVATDLVVEMDCASATFEVGDKVTIDEDSGGTFLEDQKLVKTTDETLAIGYAIKRYGSATTRVWVRLISRVCRHAAAPDESAELSSASLPVLIFNGATGINEIRVPTNLADALSIESSAGDIVVLDTTTGTVVWNFSAAVRVNVLGDFQGGNATTDLVAFHGSTPTDQCAAYTQTFATADRTHSARTATVRTVGTLSGTANGAMESVGDTMAGNVGPAISNNFQELFETLNALIVDVADTASVVNALVDDLQEKGLAG